MTGTRKTTRGKRPRMRSSLSSRAWFWGSGRARPRRNSLGLLARAGEAGAARSALRGNLRANAAPGGAVPALRSRISTPSRMSTSPSTAPMRSIPQLNLIKGGGGALLREKIVAMASDRVCIIADSSKQRGAAWRFPAPGGDRRFRPCRDACHDRGRRGRCGMRGQRSRSAAAAMANCSAPMAGILIVDCAFGSIPDAELLADLLDIVPGVVEHGLFIGIADEAVLAGPSGVTVLRADEEP